MAPYNDVLIDQPIKSAELDRLGFGGVASSLLAAITNQPNDSSMTLGLDGRWGSGKSSILGLVQEKVERPQDPDSIGTIVVRFSPWLVSNRTALVASFFAQLTEAIIAAEKRIPRDWQIRKRQAARNLEAARKKLNRFSRIISISSAATAALDPTLISTAVAGGSKAFEKLSEKGKGENKTLEELKDELTKSLKHIAEADPSFRILVLIDDLDRLDPEDVCEVLRLVKAVCDFPATFYLLAYDRSVIASAIQTQGSTENGDEYLEKIIQFSFKVPPLEPFQLRNWLRFEIERLYPGEIAHDQERTSAVMDRWAGRLLSTPRDVKRLLFAVRAIWPRLRGQADLLDLLWLQMLAMKASEGTRDLYSWVASYLQGLEAIAIGGQVGNKKKVQDELKNILVELGWEVSAIGAGMPSMDFHNLDDVLVGIDDSYLQEESED